MKVIQDSLKEELSYYCECGFTIEDHGERSFDCFELYPNSILYQGKLTTITEGDMSLLEFYLEDWVHSSPTLFVDDGPLTVDPKCPVLASAFEEMNCVPKAHLSTSSPSSTLTGGLLVHVLETVVLILCLS